MMNDEPLSLLLELCDFAPLREKHFPLEEFPRRVSGSAAIPFASLRAGLAASSPSEDLLARRPYSRLFYRFLLALALFAGLAPAAQNSGSAPLELEYHLRLLRPSTHLAEVEIVARRVTEPSLDFAM